MPGQFLHGVEVVELNGGARPVRTVKSSVIGMVGTAPDANATQFPINTPVLIAGSRTEAAELGTSGTLPPALDGIFDQAGAMVVVIRVDEEADTNQQLAHVIGGVDAATGQYQGVQALLSAESILGIAPGILIVPGFTHQKAVVSEMLGIADRLRAVIIADGPSTQDADAIAYRQNFRSGRVYLVDPATRVFDKVASAEVHQPMSPRVAGLMARSDNERGFWWSPSNQEIYGIVGTERAIDFTLGDGQARANYLNANDIATVIQKSGFRLWGTRTCSTDPKWAFLSVRRTADMINESLLKAHLWAVDQNITKTYIEDVTEGVNAYLRDLRARGAIIGGQCWAEPELNTPSNISQGNLFFDFDFTPPYPAEHITFRSSLVNDYLEEIL
ncbi:phage tail sheath subtilisin-like domain-containing protein [Candidatus Williamhamiltonella defendens]|uniref:Phage tail protein n=1 Tax=Candidatus Hamiltonella defensa (Bemisia tabaci) TaxID=672795 RepID=A0A249DWD4_9ENTR|nr:phage tail sheath subtilisin-like domain-containing protein [Candidatus Hamiltonella defensa]ASX25863.1 phage tail protein [Candidatus Hamiltonella defensa (Bemisia tabaci)]CED78837.1 Major tail sheath protein [Candidatus Hamiltonella defensa (Bemisia tabaci)]